MNKYLSFTIIILLSVLSLSCTETAVKQENKGPTDEIVSDIPPPPPSPPSAEGQSIMSSYKGSYALLIGQSDYSNGWADLNSIPSELNDVKAVLRKQGFIVETSSNLKAEQLYARFKKFVDDYGYEENNRLLFFYSGHGYSRKDGKKGYLVPTDAANPNRDEKAFLKKALNMNNIVTLARNIEAKHALFLFDSCFSGTVFKTKALPKEPPQITQATKLPVRQFITAGSANEVVPAESTFTPAFVDALKYGFGDMYRDGYITGQELGLYLQNKVPEHAEQTPQYGKIKDYELSRGDFVFVVGGSSQQPKVQPTQVIPPSKMVIKKCVALVIGNNYSEDAELKNPINDASEIAKALQKLGVDVTLKTDLTQSTMTTAIETFKTKLGEGTMGLFYYVGHGLQIGGIDYMIPVDMMNSYSSEDIKHVSVTTQYVSRLMESANNTLNILIVDTVRDNPFESPSRGLRKIPHQIKATFIAFSTSPGGLASDSSSNKNHSPYALGILKFIQQPQLSLEQVFKKVRILVEQETKGRQIPMYSSTLSKDFYFSSCKQAK